MELAVIIGLVIVGFILIVKGGDFFVDGAVAIAKITKIPPLLIGATIVSIGTTLPEMTVSFIAAANGDASLAASNAIGSMLCNISLILGITLSLTKNTIDKKSFMPKMVLLVIDSALILVFALNLIFSFLELLTLCLLFILFMVLNVREALVKSKEEKELSELQEETKKYNILQSVIRLLIGGGMIYFGARFLVDNMSILAIDYLSISTTLVGFTIVALGTSLPELVTAITAVKRGEGAISVGNVLGANMINGTLLTGLSGIIGSRGTNYQMLIEPSQMPIMLVGILAMFLSVLVLVIPIIIKSKTNKIQGVLLLSIYVAYLVYLGVTVL